MRGAGALLVGGLVLGCSAHSGAETEAANASLEQHTLTKLPESVEHKSYIDFGGKVQLLGYSVSPTDVARPGSRISLVLYWQRTGRLDAGWGLFTHILDDSGQQLAQRDSSGPLRAAGPDGVQTLGPSAWELGKIYVDEIDFEVPRTRQIGDKQVPLRTESITLAVGVWKGAARLDVLGSSSDAYRRSLLTRLKTGLKREAKPTPKEASNENKDG